MFQRLKGAIDSRIAEEQARQRTATASPSRSSSNAKRPSSRADSPAKRFPRTRDREKLDGELGQRGPDPSEFEPEFVISDSEPPSRIGTPKPAQSKSEDAVATQPLKEKANSGVEEVTEGQSENGSPSIAYEMPADVRVKLRRLEKLEPRYHELLRSYRIAHARVLTIEPFETSLRENTPLTSIADPGALAEYLNQLNLKGDMVLDELKRVSGERDSYKQRWEEADKAIVESREEIVKLQASQREYSGNEADTEDNENQANGSLPQTDAATANSSDMTSPTMTIRSPPSPAKSRTSSIPSISLFSPKPRAIEQPKKEEQSEEFFSYDSELPRLEGELKQRQEEINKLHTESKTLKGELAVARESTQSMVQTLEGAMRELTTLKEGKDRREADMLQQSQSSESVINNLKSDLQSAEENLKYFEAQQSTRSTEQVTELEERLREANENLDNPRELHKDESDAMIRSQHLDEEITTLRSELSVLHSTRNDNEKRIRTLNSLVDNLREQLKSAEMGNAEMRSEFERVKSDLDRCSAELELVTRDANQADSLESAESKAPNDLATSAKKNKKKKKKAGKSAFELEKGPATDFVDSTTTKDDAGHQNDAEASQSSKDSVVRLEKELGEARALLEQKEAAIEKLNGKLKTEEGLQEEIDSLRDDLVSIGQEHVEAKDKVKELLAEKSALKDTVSNLEKEIAELQSAHASKTAGSEQARKDLTAQFEDLKIKATTLQRDLSAAQQLASSRFKDLSDLRSVLQKAQPELITLRSEVADLRSIKGELNDKNSELRQLENRHEEASSELTWIKKTMNERDAEIKVLSQKLNQETKNRLKSEDTMNKNSQELQRVEIERRQAMESLDRLSKDLAKSQEELTSSRGRMRELEQQVGKLNRDTESLREEIELKTAQYVSAQSLMSSMRDQTTEMATQMKEARDRCESLEEEVADAHRLLSERTREGETMRRLLADVEGRTDSRIREMKDRMDTAIEERDRAEDEASTAGRRRAREIEDLRNRVREAERNAKVAEEDKEEVERGQRDWKRRYEELEQRSERSSHEVDEVRKAMSELRDALDESEKQATELEKQKAELRRSLEETQRRLDKLQKSNKALVDEVRSVQASKQKAPDSGAQSSRSSIDSGPSRGAIGSPSSKARKGSVQDAPNGQASGAKEQAYLKNVLLQFLEQRDKKHQMQLIPVLGMLLHFDRQDEQKWMAAITTR